MCDVNLTERLEPYVTFGPETRPETRIDSMIDELYEAAATTLALRKENLDTRLRLIAAICDRPSMDPTVKADVLTEIASCREELTRW